ncbi:MAG: RNA methyltransferase [Planctomycetota bacterium]
MNRIEAADDPRLSLYLNLRDRQLRSWHGLFLAEGNFVVERLIGSGLPLHSLLCADKRADKWIDRWPNPNTLLVAPDDVLEAAVGFALHQGVIAAAEIPQSTPLDKATNTNTLVVLPEITNVDNLGLIVRIAAGLGADALVLGPRCADPWYRRAVRLSMGTIFKLPIVRSDDLLVDLHALRETHGYTTIGTALRDDATPLHQAARPEKCAILLGPEGDGLHEEHLAACDHVVTIPMHAGVDSLNVAVAAGIVLHHFAPHSNDTA